MNVVLEEGDVLRFHFFASGFGGGDAFAQYGKAFFFFGVDADRRRHSSARNVVLGGQTGLVLLLLLLVYGVAAAAGVVEVGLSVYDIFALFFGRRRSIVLFRDRYTI